MNQVDKVTALYMVQVDLGRKLYMDVFVPQDIFDDTFGDTFE